MNPVLGWTVAGVGSVGILLLVVEVKDRLEVSKKEPDSRPDKLVEDKPKEWYFNHFDLRREK